MPAIDPALLRDGYKLTAEFYAAGIECPPLVELNRWLLSQQLAIGTAEPAIGAGTTQGTFEEALASALKSSPKGVDVSDLRSILAGWNMTGPQIGAALGRMAKAKRALKVGELWFAAKTSAKVDRSLIRRRGRAAAQAPTQLPQSAPTDELQQAAG